MHVYTYMLSYRYEHSIYKYYIYKVKANFRSLYNVSYRFCRRLYNINFLFVTVYIQPYIMHILWIYLQPTYNILLVII